MRTPQIQAGSASARDTERVSRSREGSWRILIERSRKKVLEVRLAECHIECHCDGKIGKRTQTDASAGKDLMTLNRWRGKRCADNARLHWGSRERLERLPLSPDQKFCVFPQQIDKNDETSSLEPTVSDSREKAEQFEEFFRMNRPSAIFEWHFDALRG
jgi:hypothetical protein